jgi:hypothetical protein
MNKNILIAAGIIAVVALIGGIVLMGGKNSNKRNQDSSFEKGQQNNQNISNEQVDESNIEGKTLKDFMEGKLGENVTCTFSYKLDDGAQLDGVAYISGKKARFDYEIQDAEVGHMESHMLMDEEYVYVWGKNLLGDEKMMGMKYKITGPDKSSPEVQKPTEQQSLDYDAPVTECMKWSPEANLLAVPSDISFESIEDIQAATIQNIPATDTSSSGSNCSICDSVPAEQKATCLQGLGCK